ncbi:MAG TPA: hypothetical protein VFZ89_13730, partial [Solirubrobacteraceae bacterium]
MTGGSQTALTPAGVRDGVPEALTGLIERRSAAVLQFCEAVCEPDAARLAAAEAFARFRAAVAAADDPASLNPEALLISATRHAAAAVARTSRRSHGVRGLLHRESERDRLCEDVPRLLAARADRMLSADEQHALAVHLEQDHGCRTIEAAWERAERAYRNPRERVLPPEIARDLLAALAGAAPLVGPDAEELEALVADAAPLLAEPELEPFEAEPEPAPAPEPEPYDAAPP